MNTTATPPQAMPEPETLDVDNDPGNEDPGSQFERDATVPLIGQDDERTSTP